MEQHPWDAAGWISPVLQPSIQEDPAPAGLGWRCNRDFFKSHSSGVPLLTWGLVTLLATLHPGEPRL